MWIYHWVVEVQLARCALQEEVGIIEAYIHFLRGILAAIVLHTVSLRWAIWQFEVLKLK